MKDIIKILTVTVIFLGAGAFAISYGLQFGDDTVAGNGFSIRNAYHITSSGGGIQDGEASASTTLAYMGTGDTASTTVFGDVEGASSIDFNILLNASSTSVVLNSVLYYSHNKIDWFAEDCFTQTSNILRTHNISPCVDTQTGFNAGANRFTWKTTGVQAKYFKRDFSVVGANAAIYVKAIPKYETPN